jgi:hypothetical protein
MTRQVKYTITNEAGEDCTAEQLAKLHGFARMIGLEAAAPDRYSILLLGQLFAGTVSNSQNPAKVVYEISALEGVGPASRTKRPTPFKLGPLRGLMHKHYLTDELSAMARNIKQEIDRSGLPLLRRMVREAQRAGELRYFKPSDAAGISQDAVRAYLRRGDRRALTGEWLIYARRQRKNYYLCLANHHTDQAHLRTAISRMCCREFPFLSRMLPPVSAQPTGDSGATTFT